MTFRLIAAAHVAQLGVERGEAVEQVLRAVGRPEAALHEPRVEDEERHDVLVLAQRGGQRRMVVHAQVATEPDDGGHHPGYGAGGA